MARYTKQTWDTTSYVNPTRMNHIEQGIYDEDLREGGTINGRLFVDEENGTTSTAGQTTIVLGNAIPTGTDKNSRGRLTLYSNNDKAARLWSADNMSSSKDIYLPDLTGTLAILNFTKILEQLDIPTTATSYNCNWKKYNAISIEAISYNNVMAQITIPTSYFNSTTNGARPLLNDAIHNVIYDVYKNTDTSIYIKAQSSYSVGGIRIYGIS